MQADPTYLADEKIRIFNKEGQEVSPQSINWNSLDATQLQISPGHRGRPQLAGLRAHQHPQPLWRLYARYAVERHFRRRLPLRLVGLRARAGRARLCRLAAEGHAGLVARPDRRCDPLRPAPRRQPTTPVNVYWVYITAWATPDGVVQFRQDIYQRDGAGPGPMATAVPAQPMARRRTEAARAGVPSDIPLTRR